MAVTTPAVPATTVPAVNTTGQSVDVAVTGGTITGILSAYPPGSAPVVTTPAVPASTVAATNTNSFPVAVVMSGGTLTHQAVNGVDAFTNQTGVTIVVPAGGTITLTYSVAPTWTWSALVAGFSGTSIPSPSSVPLEPGASVTLVYSAAPTWAWTDPINTSGNPVPPAENTGSVNQMTDAPFPPHTEGGESNLGDDVSN